MEVKYEHLGIAFLVFLILSGAFFWLSKIVPSFDRPHVTCYESERLVSFDLFVFSDYWCDKTDAFGDSFFVKKI